MQDQAWRTEADLSPGPACLLPGHFPRCAQVCPQTTLGYTNLMPEHRDRPRRIWICPCRCHGVFRLFIET